MKIEIISVGKIREKYIKLGIDEFKKRLQPYCKLVLSEVRDEPAPEKLSDKELWQVKAVEGERILQKIHPNAFVIALDLRGVAWSSEQMAKELENIAVRGHHHIVFVIGGSNGLSAEVLQRANLKVSFSKLTFPHQLMKLILLEQVYRAFKIQRGEPYHK